MTTHTTRAWPAGALGRLAPAAEDRPEDVHGRVTLLASTVDSGRAAVWLDCPDCGLDAGPYLAAEAQQLAGAHDDRIHRGRPTALIICGGAA